MIRTLTSLSCRYIDITYNNIETRFQKEMKEIKDSLIVNPTAKATTVDSDKKKRRSKQEVLADKFKKDLGLPLAS